MKALAKQDRRLGASVVEALTALLLTLGLLSLIAGTALRHRDAGELLVRRSEVVEARRIARDMMSQAVAAGGVIPEPVSGGAAGELRVRFFAGWARLCAPGRWAYRGRRLPEQGRDSVWALSGTGRTWLATVASVSRGECPDLAAGEDALVLTVDPDAGDQVLLRVFEAGRFRLSDALRYGRLGDPAQPLTGAVLDPEDSRLEWSGPAFTISARGRGDSSVVSRGWTVR